MLGIYRVCIVCPQLTPSAKQDTPCEFRVVGHQIMVILLQYYTGNATVSAITYAQSELCNGKLDKVTK